MSSEKEEKPVSAEKLTYAQRRAKEKLEKVEKEAEERRQRLLKKIANDEDKAAKARKKKLNDLLKKEADREALRKSKKANKNAKAARNRETLRERLLHNVLESAQQNYGSLNAKNVVIPIKGATERKFQVYVNAAKKRYLKRTKKLTHNQEAIKQHLLNQGIPEKYIKFGPRFKNAAAVEAAARKRAGLNTAKLNKYAKRDQILSWAQEQLGMDEAKVRSAICIKKSSDKKKKD